MNTVNGKPYFVPDATTGFAFPTFGDPPPPTRYDIIHEEAAVILPSLAVAYSVTPQLDLGVRLSAGFASLKSTVALWGVPGNYEEWNKQDALFTLDAKDNFIPAYGFGATYRPTPEIELGANWTSPIEIHAEGDTANSNGPNVSLNGAPVYLLPAAPGTELCAKGGVAGKLKGCADVKLPMTAQLGGRYKMLDTAGKLKGDVELDVDWERWGETCDYNKDPTCLNPSDFHVTVDGIIATQPTATSGLPLKTNLIQHGLQNTYAVRLGGSYVVPMDASSIVVRGGVGYDTKAARTGWERVDLDGAARTTIGAGASYKLPKWSFDAGFAVILEGTRTQNRNCNPSSAAGMMGCNGDGTEGAVDGYGTGGPVRQGPDPLNPLLAPNVQAENPVNQGTFSSHYLMIMFGASTRF
jgi:long-subunit fatty acid transport protein